MRSVGSARQQELTNALEWGVQILTVKQARNLGADGIVEVIPTGGNLLIHIGCDAFDTSICPAVKAPTPSGFHFDQLGEIVRQVVESRRLAGFSIVELVPASDNNHVSATAAARVTCNATCRSSLRSLVRGGR